METPTESAKATRSAEGYLVIDLKDEVPRGHTIELLRAETPAGLRAPFFRIHYAEEGRAVEAGLRYDLGKRVFLDKLEGENRTYLDKISSDVFVVLSRALRDPETRRNWEHEATEEATL